MYFWASSAVATEVFQWFQHTGPQYPAEEKAAAGPKSAVTYTPVKSLPLRPIVQNREN